MLCTWCSLDRHALHANGARLQYVSLSVLWKLAPPSPTAIFRNIGSFDLITRVKKGT